MPPRGLGLQDVPPCQACLSRWGLTKFLPVLASNLDPPDLHLLSSWLTDVSHHAWQSEWFPQIITERLESKNLRGLWLFPYEVLMSLTSLKSGSTQDLTYQATRSMGKASNRGTRRAYFHFSSWSLKPRDSKGTQLINVDNPNLLPGLLYFLS
jgi:hypothetical protein